MINRVKVQRSYKLKAYGNKGKTEVARYTHNRFLLYLNYWIGRLFFNPKAKYSTAGMGRIADNAKYKARGVVQSLLTRQKEAKINIPCVLNGWAYGKLEKSKKSSYDYWVRISNLWTKGKVVRIPLKSHKALNKALKNHWVISSQCEYRFEKGKLEVIVFVSKEVEKAMPEENIIGIDVGFKNSVATSDGHLGFRMDKVIRKKKNKQREHNKQVMKHGQPRVYRAKNKSTIKQLLNKEAKSILKRLGADPCSVVVESPLVLANLKYGKLQGWARNYLAARLKTLCKEQSRWFMWVNPAYSSQTCSRCSKRDRKSRDRRLFKCVHCSYEDNADVNAAKVLSQWGRTIIKKMFFNGDQPCDNML